MVYSELAYLAFAVFLIGRHTWLPKGETLLPHVKIVTSLTVVLNDTMKTCQIGMFWPVFFFLSRAKYLPKIYFLPHFHKLANKGRVGRNIPK